MVHGSSPGLGNMISDVIILPSREMSGINNLIYLPSPSHARWIEMNIHANFQMCNTNWNICDAREFLDNPCTLF